MTSFSTKDSMFVTRDHILFIGLTIIVSLVMSISFPLLTYSGTLALFGVAHVASELRFIDQRFSRRIKHSFCLTLGTLLAGIVATRIAMVFGLAPVRIAYTIELGLIFLLALSALPYTPHTRPLSLCVPIILGIGLFCSPISTILILAVLHNVTPMGFIIEIVPSSLKRFSFIACSLVFLLLPLAIASGALSVLFAPIMGIHHNFSILPTGALDRHLGVFLPSHFINGTWAVNAFSAIVFAQCMHYLAVIYVMPKLIKKFMAREAMTPFLPWPNLSFFWLIVVGLTMFLLILYLNNFSEARSVYGIAAAVHAYLEIPILLIAFSSTKKTATALGQQVPMPH